MTLSKRTNCGEVAQMNKRAECRRVGACKALSDRRDGRSGFTGISGYIMGSTLRVYLWISNDVVFVPVTKIYSNIIVVVDI